MSPDAVSSREELRSRSPLRKSVQTRQAILDAARSFLVEQPFREMTVAKLMDTTTYSRPTFYQHFADLQELMETLVSDLQADFEVEVAPWFTAESDPVPALVETLLGVVRVASAWGPLIRAVVEAAPTDKRLEAAWDELVSNYDDAATARIEADQATGDAPRFDARMTAISLNRTNIGTFVHHFGQAEQTDARKVWTVLSRMWVCVIYGPSAWVRVEDAIHESEPW
jgi:AcrR family transcriptional regulator